MDDREKILMFLTTTGIAGGFGTLAVFAYRYEVGLECALVFVILIALCLLTLKRFIAGGRRRRRSTPRASFLGGF